MADPVEVMARAMGASKAWPVVFEAGSATVLSRAALSALDAAGFAIVPKEPEARIIATVFVQTQEPSAADLTVARQAIVLLPSSPVEKVTEALADLSRDYRAMLSAAQVKP